MKTTKKKRTQRDYSLAFKLQIVTEVEKGRLTYKQAQKKYGIQGRSTVLVWLRKHGRLEYPLFDPMSSKPTPEQRIKELEAALQAEKDKNQVLNLFVESIHEIVGPAELKKRLAEQPKKQKRKK
jgi:transposase-like protein